MLLFVHKRQYGIKLALIIPKQESWLQPWYKEMFLQFYASSSPISSGIIDNEFKDDD